MGGKSPLLRIITWARDIRRHCEAFERQTERLDYLLHFV